MRKVVQTILWLAVILLVGLPVTFITTMLLSPLWSWIEATFGIESIGHSGPADWCFWTILALYLVACATGLLLYRQRRSSGRTGSAARR